ncbi:MAG: ABC transporter ATP-binding protein [Alphaproteobacteria bacterium]|nr:ABC transporter ATP-binding protein [Alphaproteobacteria bacterium]
MSAPIVELSGVTRVYTQGAVEVRALRGLDLALMPGEFTALVGPSGSGKTTALNLVGALDRPTGGRVSIEGVDLSDLTEKELSALRRDRIGFVFQSYNLIPVLTAFENAEAVLALQGVAPAARKERVMALLDELGLADMAHRTPDALSGGQQQRVAVARAIASDPAIVLADEPTANLDSETAERLLDVMRRLNRERGVTFLFSTHDPRVVAHARRVVEMVDGRVSTDTRRDAEPG